MYCNLRAARSALIAQLGERKTEGYVQNILRPRVRFTVKALPMRYLGNVGDECTYVDVNGYVRYMEETFITFRMEQIPFVMVRTMVDTIVRTIAMVIWLIPETICYILPWRSIKTYLDYFISISHTDSVMR